MGYENDVIDNDRDKYEIQFDDRPPIESEMYEARIGKSLNMEIKAEFGPFEKSMSIFSATALKNGKTLAYRLFPESINVKKGDIISLSWVYRFEDNRDN